MTKHQYVTTYKRTGFCTNDVKLSTLSALTDEQLGHMTQQHPTAAQDQQEQIACGASHMDVTAKKL